MADEHVGKTLDDIKRQIVAKIEEATRLLVTVNTLEEMLGTPKSNLADYIGEGSDVSVPQQGTSSTPRVVAPSHRIGSPRSIKPDQFLGEPPLDAAKKYIGLVGHAVHFDEIADAVQRGGAATKGTDWREKLEMSLLRSVFEVVKVQDRTYGLVSFYTEEQIEGLRGTRRRPEPKSKGKRGSGKKQSPRDKTAKPPKATANAQSKVAKGEPLKSQEKPKSTPDQSEHVH